MAKEKSITEKVKSFADAQKLTGRTAVDFSNVPSDMRSYFQAQYEMLVITEALNEGWEADYTNSEPKYFPYFYMSSSGFVFDATVYDCSGADAGNGSRLCYKTRELAKYAGEQFIATWEKITLKK